MLELKVEITGRIGQKESRDIAEIDKKHNKQVYKKQLDQGFAKVGFID